MTSEPAGHDPDLPVAATLVLLRDGVAGPEVLLLERPDRGSFAGAWVFPGGKLEPQDRPSPDAGEADAARLAAVRETEEEAGLAVAPATLVPLSRWTPPAGVPLRIRTWFFVTRAPDAPLRLAHAEAVDARWLTPGDALAAHGRGELILYPPTWVTLHGLRDHDDVDGALAAARLGGIHVFETLALADSAGQTLLWQEDGQYDPLAASPARHRLETGTLPWRYTRAAG